MISAYLMGLHLRMIDRIEIVEPEFAEWWSYSAFANSVCNNSRYVWTDEVSAFLDTVRQTAKKREIELPEGYILHRAQLGWQRDVETKEDGSIEGPVPYFEDRMKPKLESAAAGRANAQGIPVLYLSLELSTAVAEVRPWIGSAVSVSQFKTVRSLKTLDLTPGFENTFSPPFAPKDRFRPLDADTKEDAVWRDIDSAFSRPVSLDDNPTAYIPTQILSELFKDAGYEALVFRSNLGEKGHNFVLFNLDDANPLNFTCYDVEGVSIKEDQAGNTYYANGREGC